ncbi:MAG: hypothetical protein M3436_01755 [Pseudomonadota bacterium]|nr:hypothetical protein [Pseudomonadota bacterium]
MKLSDRVIGAKPQAQRRGADPQPSDRRYTGKPDLYSFPFEDEGDTYRLTLCPLKKLL